jgi:hypothetical protein
MTYQLDVEDYNHYIEILESHRINREAELKSLMSRTKLNSKKLRKGISIFAAVIIAATFFTSCGSSMESDAKKVAEITIKSTKSLGSISPEESISNLKVMEELSQKYTSPENKKKFEELVEKDVAEGLNK